MDREVQQFFNMTMVAIGLVLVFLMMGGCSEKRSIPGMTPYGQPHEWSHYTKDTNYHHAY